VLDMRIHGADSFNFGVNGPNPSKFYVT
jgi:hypothetical protein